MGFDRYVHGFWILGAIFMLIGALIIGNIEYVEGTTNWSFLLSILIAFILILLAGMFWISAAVNTRLELR